MNKKHFVLGGDLNKSLIEGYRLDFKSLFKEALVISKRNLLSLFCAYVLSQFITNYIVSLMFNGAINIKDITGNLAESNVIIAVTALLFIIIPGLIAGLKMMGVHHSIGLKTRIIDLFSYFHFAVKLTLATVGVITLYFIGVVFLFSIFGNIGVFLSLLLFLYLNISFCLVYPLIAEKKLTPLMALKVSFKLVNKNLLQFTLLFIIFAIIFIIALIPAGVGLLLFMPFYYNLMGIIYRQLCGVGVVAVKTDDNDLPPSDEFEA